MRKLLLLLLVCPLFIACSDSDNDNGQEYIDNNIIAGKWYNIRNGTDSVVATFENNIWREETWHRYQIRLEDEHTYGEYKLTEDRIVLSPKSKWPYKLNNNILNISNSSETGGGTLRFDYTKIE